MGIAQREILIDGFSYYEFMVRDPVDDDESVNLIEGFDTDASVEEGT